MTGLLAIARRGGLALAALVVVTFWLLPTHIAVYFLAMVGCVPLAIFLASRATSRHKAWLAPVLRFRYMMVLLIAAGIAVPHVLGLFEIRFLSELFILGLLAMSLDLMMGYIGLASFAHAALAGIAAYTVATLTVHLDAHPWLSILAALILGTLATTIMGTFSVRVRDIYFGIITLVFGSVFFVLANTWVSVTNGEDGLTIPLPMLNVLGLFTIDTSDISDFWYLTFAAVLASYILLRTLLRSPIGLTFRGIRDNEERVRYLGYNVNGFKILNTAISGFFVSIAGVLTVLKNGIIGTEQMDALHSGEIVIWSVVGGLGTLIGPFVGASFVGFLTDYLKEFTDRYVLIIGLIFVVTILLAPKGIVGTLMGAWREERKEAEE